jgi:hypothetical protein
MKKKQYLYHFVGGGWNQVYATSKRSAIAQAKKRWAHTEGTLEVDESSFRVGTPEDESLLMSLFY